jgi:uncharacterized protein YcfJ
MNRLVVNVLCMGMATALAVGLSACNRDASAGAGDEPSTQAAAASADGGPQYAKVVSVTPVRKTTTTPRQVCKDVVVNHTAPPKDQHRIAGTAIGAVAGGLLGHMVGGGKGKTVATVAGAVGGGYAGNKIEAAHQKGKVTSSVERQCSTVDDSSTRIVG